MARTYDAMASKWTQWADGVVPPLRERFTNVLVERLPPTSRVLDIGCGSGVPVAALLAYHFDRLDGIDISREMVRNAKAFVPTGHFEVGDISRAVYDEASFDGIVAFSSLVHLPRDEQVTVVARIFDWMRPGGVFVGNLGASDVAESVEEDWLDSGTMFWSSYDAATNKAMLEHAGFSVELACVIHQTEPAGNDVAFLWVVANKTG